MQRNTFAFARSFLETAVREVGAHIERKVEQSALPTADVADMRLGLAALRLTDAVSQRTVDEVQDILSTMRLTLLHFSPQGDAGHPQWFLARGAPAGITDSPSLFLVFQGTMTPSDIMRDLLVAPKGHGGLNLHTGFLDGVVNDPSLSMQLSQHVNAATTLPLFLCGHSLGGALAMITPCTDVLPRGYNGPITVITFGSPAVAHGGTQVLPPAAARMRILAFINKTDLIPRLLGSPVPVSLATTLLREHPRVLECCSQYCHLPQTEMVLLQDGSARSVPPGLRHTVMSLSECLSSNLTRCLG